MSSSLSSSSSSLSSSSAAIANSAGHLDKQSQLVRTASSSSSSSSSSTSSAVAEKIYPGRPCGTISTCCGYYYCIRVERDPENPTSQALHEHVEFNYDDDDGESCDEAYYLLADHCKKYKMTINDSQFSATDPTCTKIQLDSANWVEVDTEEQPRLSDEYQLYLDASSHVRAICLTTGESKLLACLLMSAPPLSRVEFKDNNKLNCRKDNLKIIVPEMALSRNQDNTKAATPEDKQFYDFSTAVPKIYGFIDGLSSYVCGGRISSHCGGWCVKIESITGNPLHKHIKHKHYDDDADKSFAAAERLLFDHNKHNITSNDHYRSATDPTCTKIQLDSVRRDWVQVDSEERDRLSEYRLYQDASSHVRAIHLETGESELLARLLMSAPPLSRVKFHDNNKLNCRKANLQLIYVDSSSSSTANEQNKQVNSDLSETRIESKKNLVTEEKQSVQTLTALASSSSSSSSPTRTKTIRVAFGLGVGERFSSIDVSPSSSLNKQIKAALLIQNQTCHLVDLRKHRIVTQFDALDENGRYRFATTRQLAVKIVRDKPKISRSSTASKPNKLSREVRLLRSQYASWKQ